jgi:hypothetical protein
MNAKMEKLIQEGFYCVGTIVNNKLSLDDQITKESEIIVKTSLLAIANGDKKAHIETELALKTLSLRIDRKKRIQFISEILNLVYRYGFLILISIK